MTMRREYRRTKVSAAESAELWERWKKGEGLHAIGQALGRGHTSIAAHVRPSGGIRPPARRRSMLALTMAEREEISRGIVGGLSIRAIARALNRSASTVSREIRRNGGLRRYRAEAADKLAWKRALRPKLCKLAICGQLRQAVAAKLKRNWSPEQIAGWLKRTHPANEARGVLKQELMAYLRSQRLFRRSRHETKKGGRARPDRECGVDQRTTGVGRGSRCAGPLGGRPHLWTEQQQYRDVG